VEYISGYSSNNWNYCGQSNLTVYNSNFSCQFDMESWYDREGLLVVHNPNSEYLSQFEIQVNGNDIVVEQWDQGYNPNFLSVVNTDIFCTPFYKRGSP